MSLTIPTTRRFGTASPLRYPGGKAALAGFFADLIEDLDIKDAIYVEPFAGGVGAGVALLLDDRIDRLVINDIDGAVYSFWKSVLDECDEFVDRIWTTPLTVEEWKRQRDTYRLADERDSVSLGFAFFYLNRTNRSGVLHAGVIGGQKQDGNYKIDARFNRDALAGRIAAIAAARDRIEVSAQDGRKVIEQWAGDPSAFLYVDPPYVDMGGSLYLNSFTDRDHVELAQTINASADANWVLTYDPVPLVQNLYRDRYSTEYELNYSAYRPGKARELLVASDPVAQVLRGRV